MVLTNKDEQEISKYVSEFLKNRNKIDTFYDDVFHNFRIWKRVIFYIYNKIIVGQLKIYAIELKNQKICSLQTAYDYLKDLERYKFISTIENQDKYKSYEIINLNEWKKLIEKVLEKIKEEKY